MKKRPDAHVIDTAGSQLFRQSLPDEWVIREYRPDYGVDFAVEVFDSRDGQLVGLGDHFLVQLKSHRNTDRIDRKVNARYNVEKMPLSYDQDKSREITVIPESLDVGELQLARSMGPATPLMLAVADTGRSEVHWVCLNDYVDKVLLPEVGSVLEQSTYTIYLPMFNRVQRDDRALAPLRLLARRAKLYGAFNRFRYQRHEIAYALERYELSVEQGDPDPGLLDLASHFLGLVLSYDFWRSTHTWPAIEMTYQHACQTAEMLRKVKGGASVESVFEERLRGVGSSDHFRSFVADALVAADVRATFDQLANLGNMFEEICREWWLPTYLGALADELAL